ncbi:Crp/Fnr family transcriptional regulator [bacterium]|nr:Crp/Fnr family transcriptional regulator [bacterium]
MHGEAPRRRIKMDRETFFREVMGVQTRELLDWGVENAIEKTVWKGEILLRAGEQQTHLWLLVRGIFRGFRLDEQGQEVTICIDNRPGETLLGNNDLLAASLVTVEALEDGAVIGFPMDKAVECIKSNQEMMALYHKRLVRMANYNASVKSILCQGTATQRYDWFCKEFPGLIERVNNRYVASFLGMTPVTFSRLRHGVATKEARENKEKSSRPGKKSPSGQAKNKKKA